MEELTTKKVIDAYKKTGLLPVAGAFFAKPLGRCKACGLGAIMAAESMVTEKEAGLYASEGYGEFFPRLERHYKNPRHWALGFDDGFKGYEKILLSETGSSISYEQGYQTAQEVKKHFNL